MMTEPGATKSSTNRPRAVWAARALALPAALAAAGLVALAALRIRRVALLCGQSQPFQAAPAPAPVSCESSA